MVEQGYAGDVGPKEAWEVLATDPDAVLIDVRTDAEWAYVGVTDLTSLGKETVFISWQVFPAMEVNPGFAEAVAALGAEPDAPLFFLCRSGVRSKAAAMAVTALGFRRCYNVARGFEGDADEARHRGTVGGWKVDGLPWAQR